MIIDTSEFVKVLKKATLNFSIGTVQLLFDNGKIRSRMVSEASDVVVLLDMNNDVFDQANDSIEFNFIEPNVNIIPFINLIDGEEADINIGNEKITLINGSQRSNMFFCSPQIVNVFGSDDVKKDTEYFLTIDVDDNFINAYAKIKKIGSQFNNVYFNVEGGKFVIEASDRTNRYSNSLRVDLVDGVDESDLSMRYNLRTFIDLMTVINGDATNFKINFTYIKEQDRGMLYAEKNDSSEKYILMSSREGA